MLAARLCRFATPRDNRGFPSHRYRPLNRPNVILPQSNKQPKASPAAHAAPGAKTDSQTFVGAFIRTRT
jgi:hypothetical protein